MQTKTLFKKSKTTLLKSALIAISSLVVTNTHSQVDIQIGTGTATSDVLPINSCSGYTYSQQIYTASEMNAGSISGPYEITKVRFMLDAGSSYGSDNWQVFIGHTSKSSFSSNSDWEAGANLTECFGGTVTYPAGGNWLEVTLSTPFQYDGSSNLVVGIKENSYASNCSNTWLKSDLGPNRGMYYSSYWSNPNIFSPPSANGRYGYVPNIQFEASPAPTCTGAPAVVNILSSEGNSLCDGDSTELTIDNQVFES